MTQIKWISESMKGSKWKFRYNGTDRLGQIGAYMRNADSDFGRYDLGN